MTVTTWTYPQDRLNVFPSQLPLNRIPSFAHGLSSAIEHKQKYTREEVRVEIDSDPVERAKIISASFTNR